MKLQTKITDKKRAVIAAYYKPSVIKWFFQSQPTPIDGSFFIYDNKNIMIKVFVFTLFCLLRCCSVSTKKSIHPFFIASICRFWTILYINKTNQSASDEFRFFLSSKSCQFMQMKIVENQFILNISSFNKDKWSQMYFSVFFAQKVDFVSSYIFF